MLRCIRTTIRLDDRLLTEAKKHAAETGRTLTAVIEDALRESFARRGSSEAEPVRLPTSQTNGALQPGVDLDDSAALLTLMETGDAAP